MKYQISALSADEFNHLSALCDDALAKQGARRMRVDTKPGFPCRVTLEDAEVGESVLLVNYEHLAVASPYRSAHAIFVREGATTCAPIISDIPEQLRLRLLSIRTCFPLHLRLHRFPILYTIKCMFYSSSLGEI